MRLSHRLLLAVLLFCAILPQHLPAADAPAGITVTSRRVDSLAASNLLSAYDAGDGYAGAKGRRTLLRLRDGVAVRVKANEPGAKLSDLTAKGSALEGFQVQVQRKDRFALLRGKVSTNQAPAAMNSRLAELRRTPGLEAVNPVFVDPASGLWVMTSDEIIIALKPGIAAKDYFGADWRRVRPMLGPPGQYVLTLSNLESEAVFAAAQRHAADARVLWAEPNFISQGLTQLIPNDPQFTNQWHLLNTGQTGGTPGADIRVTAAWDRTNGSPNVIVAVLDNGFDLSHPDLVANIATNTMEIPGNGIDDDNNGYADDIRGWNYFEANNDPSPVTVYDNHGTEVAGAAIAAGNNGVGIAGVAYGCRLLPLRIGEASTPGSFSSRDTDIANAIYYGSGGISQSDSWRGADVLVMSFESIQVTVVDDALTFATSQAHNGQGVPVFVAMGNHGDGWRTVVVNGFTAGNFTLAWTYSKNATTAAGEDAVWLSQVTFPDGTTERFDGATFPPAGWSTSGNANWTRESDPAHARGASLFTARSGVIGDNQSTTLQTTRTVTAGTLTYVFWVSSEQDADIFSLSVNGTPQTFANVSGVPFIRLGPSYPASHPSVISVGASSHWDTRSSYSQYGGKIDLVAPGGGSGGADVITTDRAGTAGDNMAASPAGDYNSAEGTSLATPVAAGVAALMLSVAPSLTATQVRDILRFTADKVGPVPYTNGWNGYYGAGRVNASNALAVAYAPSCLGIPILVTSLGDSGPGTLREAIQRANASSCTGTISLVVTGVISLASDLPAVTTMGPLSILGPGTNALTISGGNAARLFAFAANTQGRVSGLKLANGFSVNHGAAIQNSGSLVIESCLLVSNAVVNSFGGAICNFPGGTVLATNCVFTANTIRGGNGENRGPGSNGGPGGGGAGMGGAIFTEGTGLTLGGCTFLNNTAYGGNGGNGDGNGFNSDPGGNGGFPNAGTGGPVGQPGGPGGFGGGGGGGAGSFVSGAFAGGAGGFGGGGGAGGANGSGGNGGAAGAGGLYGGAAGASFFSHSGGGGGGAGLGGALFAHTGAITIVNCAFTGNLATNGVGGAGSFGGGIGSSGQGSGGAVFNHTAKITLAGVNTFSGNVASSGTPDLEASTLVTTVADSGLGSLRQAICNAAARPGADTVTFAPDLSGGVIALTSESLVITNHDGPLTITATNLPGGITISGENARNVFIVMPGESLTLDSLTISNGHAVSLFSFAPLGGGLWNYNGTALVRHCTFVNNDATFGGAMMCYQGSLTAETCTFSGNQASTSGGAIETGAGVPQVALRHCTIISNTATSSGGGIRFNSGSVTMNHCLIGGNTAPTGPDVNRVSATYASATYNLLRDGTTSGLTSGANGNLVGTAGAPIDPRLGPLQNNGGPTLTMSPLPGSPARDAGDPGFDGTGLTDQRGSNRVVYGRVDIGSVEAAVGLHTYYTFDGFGITDTLGFSSLTYQGDGPAWYNSDHRGQANSAIALNDPGFGTNNYYRINTVHDLTNSARGLGLQGDFTVSAWIYPRVLGGWKVLLGAVGPGSPGSVLFGLFDNHTYMAFWNNDIQGSRTIPLNAWTHLAFTYRAHGGEMAIYVNGLLDYADFGRSNSVRNGDVLLGFTEAIAGSYFQGFVDEFAVYCAALSPNQIEALANNSVFPNGTLPEPAIAPFAAADSCFWSVREIYSHPVGLWGRASAEAVATAPQLGSVSNYTSLVINRRDPETNFGPGSGFFNGDLPWAINNRTPQGLINGDDDNFALAAHATILIHDEDDYTFGFNSDDGARLRVFGAVFTNSSFVGDTNNPNPAIPAHRGDLLNYPRPTGASGILGVTHLKPGSYDIEFLTWEVTGGSFAEVFAAHGVKTTVDGTFRLLSPGLFAPPPTLAIERTSPAQIKVTWAPPTGCLQAASSLTGPWTETGTTNGQTIAISAGMQFFRVTQ